MESKELRFTLKKNDKIELEQKATYQQDKNCLLFELNGFQHQLDLNQIIFERKNEEYSFILDVKMKTAQLNMFNLNKVFDLEVESTDYLIEENNININYQLKTEDEISTIIIKM